MKVLRGDYRSWSPLPHESAVTIGVYDGVHLGHQHVLRTLADSGLPMIVVTFANHPIEVIDRNTAPDLLTSLERRIRLVPHSPR